MKLKLLVTVIGNAKFGASGDRYYILASSSKGRMINCVGKSLDTFKPFEIKVVEQGKFKEKMMLVKEQMLHTETDLKGGFGNKKSEMTFTSISDFSVLLSE